MTDWPTPGGTVVRAVHPDLGSPMRTACRGHLYLTMNSATPVDHNRSECRYVQAAECLVCGYVTPQLDADFFVAATDDDIDDCLNLIDRIVERLGQSRERINGLRTMKVDFLLPADL